MMIPTPKFFSAIPQTTKIRIQIQPNLKNQMTKVIQFPLKVPNLIKSVVQVVFLLDQINIQIIKNFLMIFHR